LAHLAAQGAEPLGITDGVNAGNPDIPDNFRAMAQLLRGVADAAMGAGVPVTGGNVSLHNETDGQSIWPTVMIGAVGQHPDPSHPLPDNLRQPGDEVCLITPHRVPVLGGTIAHGGGAYARINPAAGGRILRRIQELARDRRMESLRALGSGGLAAALVRMMAGSPDELGVSLSLTGSGADRAGRLFSEGPLEWVAVVKPDRVSDLATALDALDVQVLRVGQVTHDGQLAVDGRHRLSRSQLLEAWRGRREEVGA
jgi:phosphoribosylformylglycinamidine synthase